MEPCRPLRPTLSLRNDVWIVLLGGVDVSIVATAVDWTCIQWLSHVLHFGHLHPIVRQSSYIWLALSATLSISWAQLMTEFSRR